MNFIDELRKNSQSLIDEEKKRAQQVLSNDESLIAAIISTLKDECTKIVKLQLETKLTGIFSAEPCGQRRYGDKMGKGYEECRISSMKYSEIKEFKSKKTKFPYCFQNFGSLKSEFEIEHLVDFEPQLNQELQSLGFDHSKVELIAQKEVAFDRKKYTGRTLYTILIDVSW